VNPQASSDLQYTFGREPSTYLAPRELVRLTLLRSRLEHRAELRNRVALSATSRARHRSSGRHSERSTAEAA
jgi:hypothetical protein